jgi:formamidopyrimidine-DNA glycosylase
MPELPELEIVREVMQRRVVGRRIDDVRLVGKGAPIVVRDLTGRGFVESIRGQTLAEVSRRGKFLLLRLDPSALTLAINPKLTGRLQLCPPGAKKAGPLHVVFTFTDPEEELRYVDHNTMGQLYLTGDVRAVPTFGEMGPEALAVGPIEFRQRLRRYRGEIKGALTQAAFLAGIGNAYADEILWEARLHPFRKRTSLTAGETDRLYEAVQMVLAAAVERVRVEMGDDIHLKPRDFFAVHMRGGQPCPRCGTNVSEITANQRITSFCRTCQPGGLIKGMHSP